MLAVVGFYEPVVVLGLLLGVYAIALNLRYRTKQRILWWTVALILAIGAVGTLRELLLYGSLGAPPFQD